MSSRRLTTNTVTRVTASTCSGSALCAAPRREVHNEPKQSPAWSRRLRPSAVIAVTSPETMTPT